MLNWNKNYNLKSRSGFTLPEIMFSMFILTVAVTTVMGLLAAGAKRQGLERDRELASQLATAVVEAAYFQGPGTGELVDRAMANSAFCIKEVPPEISQRFVSSDGSLERATALRRKLVYLGAPSLTPIGSEQMRVVGAMVTPEFPSTDPAPSPLFAHDYARTFTCWSVDWTQFADFEQYSADPNQNSSPDFGPLNASSTLNAVELARFNVYCHKDAVDIQ